MKSNPAGKTLTSTIYLALGASHIGYLTNEPEQRMLSVFTHDPRKHSPDWIVLETREVSYTLPADFDPIAPQVAALQAKKAQITAEFSKAVADLNRQLSELQAIEYSGEAQ